MASGGIESNIGRAENVTPGEVRTLRFAIEDEDGDPVTDFTGWEFEWFMVANLFAANGLTELRASNLVRVLNAAIDSSTEPNADVALAQTTLAPAGVAMKAGTYWHELWRVDSGDERRLAWGKFEIIN